MLDESEVAIKCSLRISGVEVRAEKCLHTKTMQALLCSQEQCRDYPTSKCSDMNISEGDASEALKTLAALAFYLG